MEPSRFVVGIDLGTTNSALAVADGDSIQLASFGAGLDTFRSVLFFEGNKRALAGPAAIDRYQDVMGALEQVLEGAPRP